jgi:hypothetical protein
VVIAMKFKYGKMPARPGSMKLLLRDYLNKAELPPVPKKFGDLKAWSAMQWGMLANDTVGDCVIAGFAHQVKMWAATGGASVNFTDSQVLGIYSEITGYDPTDPSTDQGTDMVEACQYWKDNGFIGHQILGFVEVRPQNIAEAAFLFGSIGIGLQMTASQQDQFDHSEPWDVVKGSTVEGGHYVPIIGRNSIGNFLCVTWGRLQAITPRFIEAACDEVVCQVAQDWLNVQQTVTPRGLHLADLLNDMKLMANS